MRIILFILLGAFLTSCGGGYNQGKEMQDLANRLKVLEAQKVEQDSVNVTLAKWREQEVKFLTEHANAIKSIMPKPPPVSITQAK